MFLFRCPDLVYDVRAFDLLSAGSWGKKLQQVQVRETVVDEWLV